MGEGEEQKNQQRYVADFCGAHFSLVPTSSLSDVLKQAIPPATKRVCTWTASPCTPAPAANSLFGAAATIIIFIHLLLLLPPALGRRTRPPRSRSWDPSLPHVALAPSAPFPHTPAPAIIVQTLARLLGEPRLEHVKPAGEHARDFAGAPRGELACPGQRLRDVAGASASCRHEFPCTSTGNLCARGDGRLGWCGVVLNL
jgi:hypothetical protein